MLYFSIKLRRKFVGRQDNADTDSHSDSDFDGKEAGGLAAGMSEEDKLKAQQSNLELLEKRFERRNKINLDFYLK